jgi:hypothetical protein
MLGNNNHTCTTALVDIDGFEQIPATWTDDEFIYTMCPCTCAGKKHYIFPLSSFKVI